MPNADTPLTYKQTAFVSSYIQSGNATEAAIMAGYSKKTARAVGCENLTKPNIAKQIALAADSIASAGILNAEQRAEWLTGVIQNSEVSIGDKLKACDLLNRMTGEYLTRVDASVTNTGNSILDEILEQLKE